MDKFTTTLFIHMEHVVTPGLSGIVNKVRIRLGIKKGTPVAEFPSHR